MLGRASSKCLPVCPAISELVQEGQKRLNDVALHRPALSDVLVDGMQYLQRLHNQFVVDNQLIDALHKESPKKSGLEFRTFLNTVSGNWESRTHSRQEEHAVAEFDPAVHCDPVKLVQFHETLHRDQWLKLKALH